MRYQLAIIALQTRQQDLARLLISNETMRKPHSNSTGRKQREAGRPVLPSHGGDPILDGSARPAFRVAAHDIIESIRQQFPDRRLAFRELGQNSADAGATRIRIDFRYEDGCMVADFMDNGCGMTRQVIETNYLTLFDSSKEDREECIGYYSLGRISAFVYPLESLELFTLFDGNPGYHLEIRADYSGKLYEVEAGEITKHIDSEHGTLVRLRFPLADVPAFVAEVAAINESLKSELAWLRPEIKTTTCKLEGDTLKRGVEVINTPFAVPGRLSHTVDVQLASGLGRATVALGIEGEMIHSAGERSEKLESGLSPATLCIGRIPAFRTNGLPWTGGDQFTFLNLRVLIDSFQFHTNIGRNIVYLDTPFVRELLPKIFHNLILGRYIPALAKAFAARRGHAGEDTALRCLLADVCTESDARGFAIPAEVLDAPILPALYRRNDYSIRELDGLSGRDIYYSYERKHLDHRMDDEDDDGAVCVGLYDLHYTFRQWLEKRYGARFVQKKNDLVPVGENEAGMRKLTMRLRESLSVPNAIAGLDRIMLAVEGKKVTTSVTCGRFERFDGKPDTRTPAHVFESPERTVLNLDNRHIQRLVGLMDNGKRALAEHFLFREILFAKGQKLPVAHREQLLTKDLRRRFGGKQSHTPSIEDILDGIGNDIEPF